MPWRSDQSVAPTLSVQIRDQLLELVASGALEPGSRVASERDLSEQFQVARTSVREAMQGLLSLGVIERRGNRFFVVERLPDVSFRSSRRPQGVRAPPLRDAAAARAADHRAGGGAGHDRGPSRDQRAWPTSSRRACRCASSASSTGASTRAIARACGNPLLVELYGKVLGQTVPVAGRRVDAFGRSEPGGGRTRSWSSRRGSTPRSPARWRRGTRARRWPRASAHLAAVETGLIDRLV